jgi:hypothetical protein
MSETIEVSEKQGDSKGERKINVVGLFTGILTILVPFLGAWWELRIGEAFFFSLNPFNPEVILFGEKTMIPVIYWLGFSFRILIVLSGGLLILGSISSKWWSRHLVKFGSSKLIWVVAGTFISILLLNLGIPGFELPFKIPLSGVSTEVLKLENARITFQIYSRFTETFWIATFTSVLGVYVRLKSK